MSDQSNNRIALKRARRGAGRKTGYDGRNLEVRNVDELFNGGNMTYSFTKIMWILINTDVEEVFSHE